jgi:transcriptional regulator with XRE-family HTH domain
MDTTESDVTLAREAFAEALRMQMARARVNLRELSRLTRRGGAKGIAETTIGKYASGERSPLPPAQFQLEEALGVELGTLTVRAVAVYERLKSERAAAKITREIA